MLTRSNASRFLITGESVALRYVCLEDEGEFISLAQASAGLHEPWVRTPCSSKDFRSYVQRYDNNSAFGFLVCLKTDGAIIGYLNISEVAREPYHRGTVGYATFAPFAGKGLMVEGLRLLIRFAFTDLGLHRLEADIQPGNARSAAVAKKAGFELEGFSPKFVRINGAWRDHERWAIVNEARAAFQGSNL